MENEMETVAELTEWEFLKMGICYGPQRGRLQSGFGGDLHGIYRDSRGNH